MIFDPRKLIALLLVVLPGGPVAAPPVFAQTTSGTVIGTVRDRAAKGIADARVICVNQESGNVRATRTSPSGSYIMFNLPPGTYKVTASKEGYLTYVISRFPVQFNLKNVVELPQITLRLATLAGVVVDRADNLLPDALVVVTGQSADVSRKAVTDSSGSYTFNDLPAGDYTITARPASGDRESSTSLAVRLDQEETYAPAIKLSDAVSPSQTPSSQAQIGGQTDEGEKVAALIRTGDAARSNNFSERQVQTLPLGGSTYMRTFDELALLVPGVAPPPYTPGARGPGVGYGIGTAGQFSVNGARARSNNFSVDGSDNNDPDVGVRRQGFVALVPQPIESIKEISISTLLWDAELGRNLGAQVNAVSKYGTNELHGGAYLFFTDSSLNARNFFDYTGGVSRDKDPFTRAQTGFVIGGPIARDRTHFFGSFEGETINASTEQHFATPAASERVFLGGSRFRTLLPGNTIRSEPLRGATPLGRNILSFYPLPNNPGGPFGANTYTEILPADGSGVIASFKITHQVTARNSLAARYNFTDDERTLPSVNRAVRSTLGSETRSQNLSLIFDSQVSDTAFNQARFSFGRTRLEFLQHPTSPFVFSSSSKAPIRVGETTVALDSQTGPIGELVIEPYSPVGVGVFTFPQGRASNTFQLADSLSWAVGDHSVKFGANARRYQLNSRLDRLYRPQVIFGGALVGSAELVSSDPLNPRFGQREVPMAVSAVEMASLGVASSILQTITSGTPDSTIGLRFTEHHFFINDNWRARPSLTIDYGLAYEYNTVPREVNDRIERALRLESLPTPGGSRFDNGARTAKFNAAIKAYKQVLDGRTGIYEPDRNNFSPHLGLAWSPGGNTAVRAGYGIYYDTILGAVVSQSRNVFPTEIPINVDPSFLSFDGLNLNNPVFLQVVLDANGNFTNPVRLLRPGSCNQFGTCNQFGGASSDFVALIGQLFSQNLGGGLAFTLPDKGLRTPYAQQWHLTVERELFDDYLVSAAYVGTKGTKLTRLVTPNLGPNVTTFIPLINRINGQDQDVPVIFNPLVGSALGTRPRSDLGAYQIYENSARSTYHALQMEARKRYTRGYQFTASYTWSHAIDDVSDVFTIAGAPNLPQNNFNLGDERASASFDVRHRFAASLVWELPFYRGSTTGAARWLGGWQVGTIFQAQSGQPFTLTLPFDANLDGNFTDRPLNNGGLIFFDGHGPRRVAIAPGRRITDLFTLLSFVGGPINFPTNDPGGIISGIGGNREFVPLLGRNSVRGDGFISLDLSLSKDFRINENQRLTFRAEVFNAANRANFGLPIRVLGSPGFGAAVDTAAPARTVQLALKYLF
jgi:carboxypeptidase family protein